MSATVPVIGFVAGVLGIGNFFAAQMPEASNKPRGVVAFGFADDCLFPCTDNYEDPTGSVTIGAYDEHGDYAGSTASAISTSGGGETKNFDLRDESGPNPAYLLITGGESGTCVSWVATTASSGVSRAFMVGDWFNLCNIQDRFGSSRAEWFYGNVESGDLEDGTPWYPLCGWLGRDQADGHVITEVGANTATLSSSEEQDLDYLCNPPVMGWRATTNFEEKNELFEAINGKRDAGMVKRVAESGSAAASRQRRRDTRLVSSDIPSHNATYLCSHPGSRGPDFVSLHEGMHCDMETREVAPLCGDGIKRNCFDLDEEKMVGKVEARGLEKRYSKVVKWEHEQLQKRRLEREGQ